MSRYATVKVRRDDAEEFRRACYDQSKPAATAVFWRIRAAFDAALRSPARRPSRQAKPFLPSKGAHILPRTTAKASKREETRAVREACIARAGGKCECGCGLAVVDGDRASAFYEAEGEMDHFFPRRHCERHRYAAEAERARKRLEGIISVREREAQRRQEARR